MDFYWRGHSPTPTTDKPPDNGVGEEDTVDIILHCSFTTGSKKYISLNRSYLYKIN